MRFQWAIVIAFLSGLVRAQAPLPAWHYTTERPADGWEAPGFDDSGWKSGPGGFGGQGEKKAPGSVENTDWSTSDIWLRRAFTLDKLPARPALYIHHDDDAEVWLNGRQIATLPGYTVSYQVLPLTADAAALLKTGENLLAIHCHQGIGGQYIDAHLVDGAALPDLRALVGRDDAVRSKLITPWGEKVTPENAWREYPRPELRRPQWTCLNGLWDYAVTTLDADTPSTWNGKILVPFPLESRLSGVQRLLQPGEALWYRRALDAAPRPGKRTLLHFEAVDYRCRVWVNDTEVGGHTGGNLAFRFDITDALKPSGNTLTVRVEDATGGAQLRGKQTLNPGGILYTRNSGIWQTVWLEDVPARHIAGLEISTDIATGGISVRASLAGAPAAGETFSLQVSEGGKTVAEAKGALALTVPQPKLWSPAHPNLYDLRITLRDGAGGVIDEVDSYTALRKVGRVRDAQGHYRFTLNDQPVFHFGPLDQGWWPDGLLTPPSVEAMAFEIQWLRDAGFNMIRKHIKVEPRQYYHLCDRIGMLVWQDQVSGGGGAPWTHMDPNPTDAVWTDEDHRQWRTELDGMIAQLSHFPCIVVWTPFNEAWGQHRTMEAGAWTVMRDSTRQVNIASGGNFWPVGHIADEHRYPHPDFPLEDARFHDYIKVVGEFGGHGWPVKGHLWNESRGNWGYGGLPKDEDEYRARYAKSIELLVDLKAKGISGGVYTQTTDVEEEINGLMTYDRRVIKIPAADLKAMHAPLTGE